MSKRCWSEGLCYLGSLEKIMVNLKIEMVSNTSRINISLETHDLKKIRLQCTLSSIYIYIYIFIVSLCSISILNHQTGSTTNTCTVHDKFRLCSTNEILVMGEALEHWRLSIDALILYYFSVQFLMKSISYNQCFNCGPGLVFCLLLEVISDYAQPITGQVTEVICPVIGRAQPELTPSKRQKTGPWQSPFV